MIAYLRTARRGSAESVHVFGLGVLRAAHLPVCRTENRSALSTVPAVAFSVPTSTQQVDVGGGGGGRDTARSVSRLSGRRARGRVGSRPDGRARRPPDVRSGYRSFPRARGRGR